MDAVLISKPSNVFYLSGFISSNGFLLISDNSAVLLTDFRYETLAKSLNTGFKVEIIKKSLSESLLNLSNQLRIENLGIEASYLSYQAYLNLKETLKNVKLNAQIDLVEKIRLTKEDGEISLIKQSAKIADRVFDVIIQKIVPGVTEIKLANEIDNQLKANGAKKPAFDIIVASGPNSSIPHAAPTNRKFIKGDFIKIDFGALYEGYCSDITRTFVLGKASLEQKNMYCVVLESQRRALEIIKPGIEAKEVDFAARDFIINNGFGDKFGHNTGHGVGLEIHEKPIIGSKSTQILTKNMVFTVEPGIYIPDSNGKKALGGVRIEDLVVVTANGSEILSKFSKELVEL